MGGNELLQGLVEVTNASPSPCISHAHIFFLWKGPLLGFDQKGPCPEGDQLLIDLAIGFHALKGKHPSDGLSPHGLSLARKTRVGFSSPVLMYVTCWPLRHLNLCPFER